jgi:zinc/manganese transport system permease protein
LCLRPATSIALSGLFAVCVAWFGLACAYFTDYPVGFLIATNAFVLYCGARVAAWTRERTGRA